MCGDGIVFRVGRGFAPMGAGFGSAKAAALGPA